MADGPAGALPRVIPDARFSVPTDAGPVWASGSLLAAEGGIWLVSSKDPLDVAELPKTPAQVPGRLGTLSFVLPRAMIARVVHDRLVGFFIEIPGKKVPLRLDVAGWKALDEALDLLGIAHS
jgi:hypothetical protein